MSPPTLLTITYSHFCEKARWALQRCEVPFRESGHVPIVSRFAGLVRGVWDSVPLLFTSDGVIRGSGAIARWADEQGRGESLFCSDSEVCALEARFNDVLGPEARRFAYHYALQDKALAMRVAAGTPKIEQWVMRASYAPVCAGMRRGMRISDETVPIAKKRIDEVFELVAARLADGRPFLTGDRFTLADLTFASLASVVLLPPQHPVEQPGVDDYPELARTQFLRWRQQPAGQFAMRLYSKERNSRT